MYDSYKYLAADGKSRVSTKNIATSKYTQLADLIDKERIANSLEHLANISDPAFGSTGVTRLAYSDTDIKGKNYIADLMTEAGLEVRVSPIGNTFGRLNGPKCDRSLVLTGSHTDSVINGGRFDGIVGVICAIEALRVLQQVKDDLIHPLEVIDFTMEESARFSLGLFGGKVFMGEVRGENSLLLKDDKGISLAEALQNVETLKHFKKDTKSSFDAPMKRALRVVEESAADIKTIHAYVELHVEQAGFLEEAKIPIGIVSGAAMPTRWAIEIIGEQAHSGTTPMERRKGALVPASEFVLQVDKICKEEAAHGTVGAITKISVEPNAMNTVPGKCSMFLDLRSTNKESKDRVKNLLLKKLDEICTKYGVTLSRKVISEDDPKTFSPNIMAISQKACESLGVQCMVMPSRAGHDACTVSNHIKEVGMIFIPSKGGVSHHHEEWTDINDIVLGTKILLLTLLELATRKA